MSRPAVWQKYIYVSKEAVASIFLKRMSPKHQQVYTTLYSVTFWKTVIFVATSHFYGHVARRIVIRKLESKIQGDTKKRELLKNPTKIEEIQEKKFIDRN